MLLFARHIVKVKSGTCPWHLSHLLVLAFMLALFLSVAAPTCAFASGLGVQDSCPVDKATAVPTSGRLWVRFDHNVAAVAENASRVHLLDATGVQVSEEKCRVALPDTDAEFDLRQYIFLDVEGLDAGATYTIRIDASLAAKNGSALDTDTSITFTTVAAGEEPMALPDPESQAAGTGGGSGSGSGSAASTLSEAPTVYIDAIPQGGAKVTGSDSSDGVVLVEWSVDGTSDDSARRPYMGSELPHYIILEFNKGIDYYPLGENADKSVVEANCAKVSLQRADGTPVDGARVYTLQSTGEGKTGIIYIDLEGGVLLNPMADYRIVVESGLRTYSGSYMSTSRYVISFRTNAEIGGGWTVTSVFFVVAAVLVVLAGVGAGIYRRRKERVRRG